MEAIAVKDFAFGYPVTIYIYSIAPRCARCERELSQGERAYLIRINRNVRYLVCDECFKRYESKNILITTDMKRIRAVDKVRVTIVKDYEKFKALERKISKDVGGGNEEG